MAGAASCASAVGRIASAQAGRSLRRCARRRPGDSQRTPSTRRPSLVPHAPPPRSATSWACRSGSTSRDADGVDVEPAFAWLREVDATFSTYRADSDISRLDRGELTLADCRPEVDEVLTRCLALERATRGYFSVRARRPARSVRARQGLGGRRRRRAARGGGRARTSASTPAATSSRAAGPAPDRRWRVGIRHPERARPARRGARRRGPRRRHVGRVRARRAHPRPAHRPPARPGCCRSPSWGRTSRPPTPTRPPRSPWAPTGRRGRRRSTATTRCASRADHRVLSTPGFARHRARETDPVSVNSQPALG